MNRLLNRATRIKKINLFSWCIGLFGVILFSSSAFAEAVIQGYQSDTTLEKGRIVALVDKNNSKVEAASADDLSKMYGVVVDANDAPVTLTIVGQKTFVATVGKYPVLVSSENGTISAGDFISMSSAKGIGAKATDKQTLIIGKAQESFDGKSNAITTTNGVGIGRIIVDIGISKNPTLKSDKNYLPEFLRKAGDAIAGKPVSPYRVYLGLFLILVTGFVSGSLMYGGVRSAIISVGRNPLGKKKIVKGLLQVLVLSIIIFIVGLFGVYLLIKL